MKNKTAISVEKYKIERLGILHLVLQLLMIGTGIFVGTRLTAGISVTVACLITCLSVMITDIRLLSLSDIESTYGMVTKVDKKGDSSNITIAYKPLAKAVKEVEIPSNQVHVFVGNAQKSFKDGSLVLVEHQRSHDFIAVGGKLHILFEMIANTSSASMVGYFLKELFIAIF